MRPELVAGFGLVVLVAVVGNHLITSGRSARFTVLLGAYVIAATITLILLGPALSSGLTPTGNTMVAALTLVPAYIWCFRERPTNRRRIAQLALLAGTLAAMWMIAILFD